MQDQLHIFTDAGPDVPHLEELRPSPDAVLVPENLPLAVDGDAPRHYHNKHRRREEQKARRELVNQIPHCYQGK
jgi:hypothetical protein